MEKKKAENGTERLLVALILNMKMILTLMITVILRMVKKEKRYTLPHGVWCIIQLTNAAFLTLVFLLFHLIHLMREEINLAESIIPVKAVVDMQIQELLMEFTLQIMAIGITVTEIVRVLRGR